MLKYLQALGQRGKLQGWHSSHHTRIQSCSQGRTCQQKFRLQLAFQACSHNLPAPPLQDCPVRPHRLEKPLCRTPKQLQICQACGSSALHQPTEDTSHSAASAGATRPWHHPSLPHPRLGNPLNSFEKQFLYFMLQKTEDSPALPSGKTL